MWLRNQTLVVIFAVPAFAVNRTFAGGILPVTTTGCCSVLRQTHEIAVYTAGSQYPVTFGVSMKVTSLAVVLAISLLAWSQNSTGSNEVEAVYSDAHALYIELHQHPELSGHEVQTAAKLEVKLRNLGYEVTNHVGGTGIVAVLKNGPGPTITLRTELDALPVEEKTGLPYASIVRTKDDSGRDVPVMHACGHDLHMAALVGTATIMAHSKETWHGTLMLIGQPAK